MLLTWERKFLLWLTFFTSEASILLIGVALLLILLAVRLHAELALRWHMLLVHFWSPGWLPSARVGHLRLLPVILLVVLGLVELRVPLPVLLFFTTSVVRILPLAGRAVISSCRFLRHLHVRIHLHRRLLVELLLRVVVVALTLRAVRLRGIMRLSHTHC
jgi:hypothetical protein